MKKTINTIEEALILDLESMYCAESHLANKLEKVLKVISSEPLRDLLASYLESSENRKLKIDRVFSYLNHEPKACATSVIHEMIEDIFKHISFASDPKVQDLLITKCLQRITTISCPFTNPLCCTPRNSNWMPHQTFFQPSSDGNRKSEVTLKIFPFHK